MPVHSSTKLGSSGMLPSNSDNAERFDNPGGNNRWFGQRQAPNTDSNKSPTAPDLETIPHFCSQAFHGCHKPLTWVPTVASERKFNGIFNHGQMRHALGDISSTTISMFVPGSISDGIA